MKKFYFFLSILMILLADCFAIENIYVSKLFTKQIEPSMFNFTFQVVTEQFRYRPTLKNHPALPSWMSYMYSNERHCGYLYGTPSKLYSNQNFQIEIVALNKQNYETRRRTLSFKVINKEVPENVVAMKIDNLNWVHLMDAGRVENLKNIFRNDLWPESKEDLEISFMESAVKMGARVPMKPAQREGVIVHLASKVKFSDRLLELQEEVKPLYKIQSCNYKRTSVQNIFENSGFKLDWCAFKIIADEANQPEEDGNVAIEGSLSDTNRWIAPSKDEIPERNYSDELALAIAFPGVIFAILLATLTVVLCFHHEKFEEPKTTKSSIQMVMLNNNNPQTTTTTLKSLHNPPNVYDDNLSFNGSENSLYRENSPRTAYFKRPNPPPYKSNNAGI